MADREDFATAVGALIKGRSPVGHTHSQIANAAGTARFDSSGALQHLTSGQVRWQVNPNGELATGTVPWARIGAVPAHVGSDTGLRDLTAHIRDLTSGRVFFDSKNGHNTIYFQDAVPAVTGTWSLQLNSDALLDAWAPVSPLIPSASVNASNTTSRRAYINFSGGVGVYGVATGDVINGQLSWIQRRAFPTIYPGDPT